MWFLGRPDEALQRALRALELSREPARAYSAATACAQLASLHACRDDPAETLHWAQATVDVARDRGYDYRVAMGRVLRGWAFAAAGRPDGVEEITCGLDASRATGAHLEDPFYLGLLADAHLRGGAYAAGLEAVEEGLAIAARERARYYDAELHRLRGELQLAAGENAAAERSLRAALDVAREQGACSLELRAALALARAFPGAGNRALLASARQALGEADTADTRAAAALLGGVPTAAPEPHTITVLAWQVDGLDAVAPARLPALVAACHAAAQVVAAREKGQIATEDEAGGLIYFGYPQALDDAAARAVRTGRALAEVLRAGVNGERLALCAGIDTGAAVIAPLGTSELALGRTPRTAWRLAATADPGDVLVSDATRARCAGAFAFAPQGGGFRVTGERAQRGAERAPLIGRARELDLLLEGWRQAERGLGQAVLLTGEPGIGKSRLVRELTRLADVPALLELQCADTGTASPLHPFAGHLRAVLADEPGGLEALLGEVGLPVAEATPVLATLLGGPARLDPDTLRRRTLDLVCAYVLAHAREPLLLLVEDVHWADPSTLRTLDALVEAVVEAPVLLVATARTDATIEWPALSHITRLALRPCSRPEAEALLARVAHAPSAAADILDRAAGIPFQLEELGRTPADTLEQALAARLDRLSASARDTAQLGALIGHEFAHDLAAASSELEAGAFDAAVAELVAAEQVRVHGRPPARRYDFRHALLREAAAAEAPATHARIARALERRFPDLVRAAPEILARHLEAAGQPRRAVVYRAEAGRMALRRGAGAEAVEQFRRALAVGELSGELELELQTGLGNALLAARGYASPEAAQAFSRARAAGTPAVYGLWVGAVVRARHEQALALGHELGDTPLIGERAIGWPLLCLGRFEEARAYLDQVPGRDGGPAEHVYGPDPLSAGLAAGAWALWGCDEAEAAEQRAAEAIERARELAHPLTLAHALGSGALLAAFREDPAAARSRAVEAIAIAEEFTLGLWAAWSRYALGAADLAAGEPNRAAATVQAGLLAARAAGAALLEPFALTVLGDAERAAGRTTAAHARHEEARAAARRTGEHPWR